MKKTVQLLVLTLLGCLLCCMTNVSSARSIEQDFKATASYLNKNKLKMKHFTFDRVEAAGRTLKTYLTSRHFTSRTANVDKFRKQLANDACKQIDLRVHILDRGGLLFYLIRGTDGEMITTISVSKADCYGYSTFR